MPGVGKMSYTVMSIDCSNVDEALRLLKSMKCKVNDEENIDLVALQLQYNASIKNTIEDQVKPTRTFLKYLPDYVDGLIDEVRERTNIQLRRENSTLVAGILCCPGERTKQGHAFIKQDYFLQNKQFSFQLEGGIISTQLTWKAYLKIPDAGYLNSCLYDKTVILRPNKRESSSPITSQPLVERIIELSK